MLTQSLLDRLVASTLVPHSAKIAAIQSWRRELATTGRRDASIRRLEQHLAVALMRLAGMRSDQADRSEVRIRSAVAATAVSRQLAPW